MERLHVLWSRRDYYVVEEWIQIRLVVEKLWVDCMDMRSHGVVTVSPS